MHQELPHLIQSLRNELMAWAEMSIQLDRHFQFLELPSGGVIGETANHAQIKGRAVQRARQERTRAQATMARVLQLERGVPIEKIIPVLPAAVRPLVIALVRAGRELLAQVLLTFRRKQASLRHAVARVRHFLNNLFPGQFDEMDPAAAPKPVSIPVNEIVPPVIFDVEIAPPKPNPFRFVPSRPVHGFHSAGFLNVPPYSPRISSKNGTQLTN